MSDFLGRYAPKKDIPPKVGCNITAITGKLLIRTKSFGEIWSFWEDFMTLYMGGRQIFKTSHEVHKK
jgi:hypothetical protein